MEGAAGGVPPSSRDPEAGDVVLGGADTGDAATGGQEPGDVVPGDPESGGDALGERGDGRGRPGGRRRTVAAVGLLVVGTLLGGLAVVLATRPDAPAVAAVSPSDPARYAAELVADTAEQRAAHGVGPLRVDACAAQRAHERAAALVGADELTHAPLTPVLRACDVDVAAENLSRASAPPQAVVDAWMDSTGHRANLLDRTLVAVGIGCVHDGDVMLCSQVFLGE